MNEVNKQKGKPGRHEKPVNEGSAARTRPTSVEEIMLRRKSKKSFKNVKEETVGAIQLLDNDLVEKTFDYHESEKGYDRSKKVSREERVKNSSSKKEGTIFSSREGLDKPMKEDPVGTAQLHGNDLVEKVSDYHESKKGYDRSKKLRREEHAKDSSRKKEEAISSSREEKLEKPMKEDPVQAAQLLGNNFVESVSDYHESEKGYDRSVKLKHEEHFKASSRKKEDAISCSGEERLDKPMKEDLVGGAQLLTETVSDYHVSETEHNRSKKVMREERVKDSSRKKEHPNSNSREERLDKPIKADPFGEAQLLGIDLLDKGFHHVSEKGHDRSKKLKREERVKDSSRSKEDAMSSSRKEKPMKEYPVGAAQLLGNDFVHESGKGYDRSEKRRCEERLKYGSRKKEDAISSSREEKLDKPKKEDSAAYRKRKAEGEHSTAEAKLVGEHIKDRQRKKEETNSCCREERLDKRMKKEDLDANRKMRIEGKCSTTEMKTMTDKNGLGVDTKTKEKKESPAAKTTEKQIHPQETGREQARNALENLHSGKRLRSLVVADIPRDENSMKSDNGNKRKNQNGDHKKNRERNMSKRHDPGKMHSVEASERWEKSKQPKSHQREMREKRRRSRSRDHGKDRQKRLSPLPRVEKASSHHKRNHEECSENAVKDRSGKHYFNVNENKVASIVDNKSRRYSASESDIGGYSPRKRREEASVKVASPPNRSSEKISAKWDLAPTVTAGMFSSSVFSGLQAATQAAYPTINEASVTLFKPLMEAPFRTPPARQPISVDSVQLTESTRRMRRLYAEHVPDSASEKSLIECFNDYMLSSGSNYIKGSEPCISCIINKEKSQALVEFLTPQDASAALSLDGCSFAGSILKIRRPKDYVETASGELEKKEPATNAISDNVEDSLNKIFVGGFPKSVSSEMLMEIVSVFGPLKAYRFVISNDLNQPCAFLEYIDGSVTLKACAGLNGMKLGGSVITAVCALPDASVVVVNENPPYYGIPEHAKPLLGKPKHILKLKNVVAPEDLPSLSEPQLKEILEDVRLECARFGVIKSINIVEHKSKDIIGSERDTSLNPESTDSKEMDALVIQKKDVGSRKVDDIADNEDPAEAVRRDSLTGEDKLCEPCSDPAGETNTQAIEDHDSSEQEDDCEIIVGKSAQDEPENLQGIESVRAVKTRWDAGDKIEDEQDPEDVFEPGCILIEYRRPEATREAAHLLHGRLYENRIVKVEYVSKELYQIRFPSG